MKTAKTALILVSLLLLIPAADASSIERSFPKDAVVPGETIAVTLSVYLTSGETFYLVDETVPEGWTVTDSDTGDFTDSGHVKWAVIQDAANTAYTYEVRAPQTAGRHAFFGKYMFEGMTTEGKIGGQQELTVSSVQEVSNNPPPAEGSWADSGAAILSIAAFSAAIVAAAYYVSRKSRGGKTKPAKPRE